MKDSMGKYYTQGLFLELGYNKSAIFTLDNEDKTYKGKLYPSLKKLYLDEEDVTEFIFARKYLLGWEHWQRMVANKAIFHHIDKWRYELTLQLRAAGIRSIIELTADDKSFQAAKWLAEEGWSPKKRGRPNKDTEDEDRKFKEELEKDYIGDVAILSDHRK